MSGHSKWKSIKHKKAITDAKRGQQFTKLIREITVAARAGGGNPDSNPRLRLAVDTARGANMPNDNIERAIKKGTGDLEGVVYEEITYEGYGPGGTALFIEVVTDNANRTVAALRNILEGKAETIEVTAENLSEYLGVRKFRHGMSEEEDQIGAVTGLAWTEVGGELLTIEAVTVPGKGQIRTTGKLGDVMQESIQAAFSFVKARAPSYGVKPSLFSRKDIHVHLPEGAVPKDGPSAGIGMVTAIISTLTGIPVRRDVAMTGEVTLRGRVLPIGGLKEKLLAALRGGITKVLIPADNEKDLVEIPANIKEGLELVIVSHVDEVLAQALATPVVPIEWTEADELAALPPSELPASTDERPGVSIRH